jgi:TatD DNase family protein
MRLVDTHCHLDFDAYDADRAEVIARATQAGVWRIVNPGVDLASSRAALSVAGQYQSVYAAVGLHPNSSAGFADNQIDVLRRLSGEDKIVAIGEIGLDYYRDRALRADQRRAFEAQLALAAELHLPVIVHNRDASEDVLAILTGWASRLPDPPGVLHSFSQSWAVARRALELGFYLGFTGPLTFKKADELRAVAACAPTDRLLVETDAPFLAPHPHRGQRNQPAYVRYTAARLAAVRAASLEGIAARTTANACALFGWQT